MSINYMYGNTIGMAEKALGFQWAKQQVLSDNIANVDTPGYKSRYVTFEEAFTNRLNNSISGRDRMDIGKAVEGARWRIHRTHNETARLDGNNVQPDVELVEMTRTALQYQHLMNSVSSDIRRLTGAIKGQ